MQEAGEEIVLLLLHILNQYGFDKEKTLHTVRGLRSLVHGFATIEQKQGFNMNLCLEQSFERLITTYLIGLKQKNT